MRSDCRQCEIRGIPGLKSETWGTRNVLSARERIGCR
jgi:hypothetical protein